MQLFATCLSTNHKLNGNFVKLFHLFYSHNNLLLIKSQQLGESRNMVIFTIVVCNLILIRIIVVATFYILLSVHAIFFFVYRWKKNWKGNMEFSDDPNIVQCMCCSRKKKCNLGHILMCKLEICLR